MVTWSSRYFTPTGQRISSTKNIFKHTHFDFQRCEVNCYVAFHFQHTLYSRVELKKDISLAFEELQQEERRKKRNKQKNDQRKGNFPTWTAFRVVLWTDAAQPAGAVGTESGAKPAPGAAVPRPGTGMEAPLAGTLGEAAGRDGVAVAVSVAAVAVACIEINWRKGPRWPLDSHSWFL